jgi:hypothetical protein
MASGHDERYHSSSFVLDTVCIASRKHVQMSLCHRACTALLGLLIFGGGAGAFWMVLYQKYFTVRYAASCCAVLC